MLRTQIAIATVCAALALTGCAHKKVNPEIRTGLSPASKSLAKGGAGSDWNPSGAPGAVPGFGGAGSSLAGNDPFATDGTGSLLQNGNMNGVEGATEIADLEMVHFDYDQSDLTPEWQTTLDHHAQWLTSHPGISVQIEGHCDERGTEEYNVALGQRRADTVRQYLVEKGVEDVRLTTISYGKLRPLAFGTEEAEHALNRRAMFLVYTPSDDTASSASY
ncbi:peptidoglycan-associated lipoprotein Pal [Candidatus Poribacteria bacterium]|nr:peptidoglycan-associated lipoprotein Pal [Candidatus Poribacteria bacterium]